MNNDNVNLANNSNATLNQVDSNSLGSIVINNDLKKPISSLEEFEKQIAKEEKLEEKNKDKIDTTSEKNIQEEKISDSPAIAETSSQEEKILDSPAISETPSQEEKIADSPAIVETPSQEEKIADSPAIVETPSQEENIADSPAVAETPSQEENIADSPAIVETPSQEEKIADSPAIAETPSQEEKIADSPAISETPSQEENTKVESIETLDLGNTNEINDQNKTETNSDNLEVFDLGNQENNNEVKANIIDDNKIGDLDKIDESQLDDNFVKNTIENIVADHDEKTPQNENKTESVDNNGTEENKREDFQDVKGIAAIKREELKESGYIQVGKTEKNLVMKIEKVKKKEIMDVIECFYETEKMSSNEKTIINKYINEYIDVKYYNKNAFNGYSNFYENIRVCLIDFTKNLYRKADSAEEKNIIIKIANLFLLVNVLDSEEKFDINTRMINSKELKFENKSLIVKKLLKIFKYYDNVYYSFLKKLKSNVFTLQVEQIDSKCELYSTNVSSNLKFSEVFNHEIIEKAYMEEIAYENMKDVQLKLISIRICEEMLSFNFDRKYTIYLPESVYEKEKKLKSLLSTIDDLYSQNKVFIVITPEILKKYFKLISKYKKEGYMFVLEIYASYLSLITDMKLLFAAANYIVIVGEGINEEAINASIPKYLLDKILYTDKSINMGVICE